MQTAMNAAYEPDGPDLLHEGRREGRLVHAVWHGLSRLGRG